MTVMRKVAGMACLGAIGAAIGGAGGEALFAHGPHGEIQARSICLLFDTSGSMSDPIDDVPFGGPTLRATSRTQLDALKEAAVAFVDRQDLSHDELALVVFSTSATTACPLSQDKVRIQRAILSRRAEGITNMAKGIQTAGSTLGPAIGEKWILLFSDGKPKSFSSREDPEAAAIRAAARQRERGIKIVAIGAAQADGALLARITGDAGLVLNTDPDNLMSAFAETEKLIKRQMLSMQAGSTSFQWSIIQAAAWAALIAIGAGLALVFGQSHHMRRRPRVTDILLVIIGGMLTGCAAGTVSQSIFYVLAPLHRLIANGAQVAAWALLGAGITYGMSRFIPNLNRRRATMAGALAGVVAGVGFLTIVPTMGLSDMTGRLSAAALLGLATGMALVIIEVIQRRAWVVVHWSQKEQSTMSLGRQPLIVGRAANAHICPDFNDEHPVRARIFCRNDQITCDDVLGGGQRSLNDGDELEFGPIRLQIRHRPATEAPPEAQTRRKAG